MHHKRHDASGQNIVLHESIPSHPQALEEVEMDIIFGDLVKLTPVRI